MQEKKKDTSTARREQISMALALIAVLVVDNFILVPKLLGNSLFCFLLQRHLKSPTQSYSGEGGNVTQVLWREVKETAQNEHERPRGRTETDGVKRPINEHTVHQKLFSSAESPRGPTTRPAPPSDSSSTFRSSHPNGVQVEGGRGDGKKSSPCGKIFYLSHFRSPLCSAVIFGRHFFSPFLQMRSSILWFSFGGVFMNVLRDR